MTGIPKQDQQITISGGLSLAPVGDSMRSGIACHLLQALDAGKDTILLTDANAVILYANQAMLAQSGCDAQALIGQTMTSLWVQPNALTQDIMAELNRNSTWRGRIQHKSAAGVHFWESSTISPVTDEHGTITHLIKTGQVIDDETGWTAAHDRIDTAYKSILDLMGDGYLETDLKGNTTFLNDSAARIYQRTPEEMIGVNYKTYMTPDESEKIFQVLLEIYQTGCSDRIIDYEIIGRDGASVACETIITLLRDHQGNPVGFGGVIRNVTDKKRLTRQLKESKESYHRVVELAPDAITITRVSDGRYLEVNEVFCQQTGYTYEEVIGRTAMDLNIYADPEDRRQIVEAIRKEGRVSGIRVNFRHRDGSLLYDIVSSRIIQFKGEECLLFVCTLINPLVEAQDALKEREKNYYTILNAAPYGIVIARRSDAACVFVNDAYCERTGYSREETIGRTTKDLNLYVDPTQRDRMVERFERDGKVLGMEVEFRAKSGKTHESLISVNPIIHMGESCLLIITMDISAQKEAQRQFTKSEQRFRTIFESARDGIFLKDRNLKYTLVNPAMERLYKIKSASFIGYTDQELFGEQAAVKTQISELQVLQGKIVEEELKVRNKSAQTFHTIKIPQMGKSGKISGICGFVRDITSVKQLEAQLLQAQKMEAVGTLAGGISHDFNNLLQAIIGYSQMLLMEENGASTAYPKLKAIGDAAQRASELTAQLLTFSRKVEIHPRPVNLNHIVHQVEKLLKRTIPKMIDIELHLANPLLTVNVDPGQVEQVLLNIGVNARDAMPGGGCLVFETSNVSGAEAAHSRYLNNNAGEYVMLSVADNGQGMPGDILEHIFEPFYTTKEAGKGTGLGLAMVYGIIQNHGGRIFCESSPGKGTCFYIYFPAINTEVVEVEKAAPISIKKGNGETILFIDDEEALRDLAGEFLADAGYKAVLAENGEAGLAVYKEKTQSISVVILDLLMPGMGGKSCLQEILKINPKAKVIICSGHSPDDPDTDEILQKAICFLKKPYDFKKLLQLLEAEIAAARSSD